LATGKLRDEHSSGPD